MVSLADYAGREQSYVKHVLLESYLEKLVHKIASRYDHVAYVDGFAGPWLSANERFEDTSFGIALNALRNAKATWKQYGRDVRMSAFLVERNKTAYSRLAQVPARYPDVMIKTHCADFLSVVPTILGEIPPNAFAFFLIDPKGWRVPLKTLAPLLARPNSEVIFNFMFDFINRAASINEPKVVAGLDELIPLGSWRAALAEGERSGGLSPEERNEVLVNAFSDNLRQIGNYGYVAETAVLRPTKDRPLYSLLYCTRSKTGIEVFRECQIAALEEQSRTRAAVKIGHAETTTGQGEIFQSLHEMGPDDLLRYLQSEREAATRRILELTPAQPNAIQYDQLWPQILARRVVTKVDVNKIVARLRTENKLLIPDWEKRRRVPQDGCRLQRA
ncbi:MAG: three-Cys-motif partner protein TcmP [Rhizomicrobium sp.]